MGLLLEKAGGPCFLPSSSRQRGESLALCFSLLERGGENWACLSEKTGESCPLPFSARKRRESCPLLSSSGERRRELGLLSEKTIKPCPLPCSPFLERSRILGLLLEKTIEPCHLPSSSRKRGESLVRCFPLVERGENWAFFQRRREGLALCLPPLGREERLLPSAFLF